MNFSIYLILFLSGVTVTTFSAAGVLFYKIFRDSQDKFYLYFGIACWLLALERIAILTFIGPAQTSPESSPWAYTIRLIAFLFIILAIYKKNRTIKN